MTSRLVRTLPILAILALVLGAARTASAQPVVNPTTVATTATAVTSPATPSAQAPFTITNGSAADDLDIDLTGAGCPGFAVDTPHVVLAAGTPVTVNATYAPAVRGNASCPAKLKAHGTSTVRGSFTITGSGTGSALGVSATTIAFDPTRVTTGAISTKQLILTNTGDGPDVKITAMTPTGGTAPGDFSVLTGPGLPLTLAQNQTATFTLQFDPSAGGNRTTTLQIASDAAGVPTTNVALSGSGTNAVLTVPATIAFGIVPDSGPGAIKTISIANTGALPVGPLAVTAATLTDSSGWFSFDGACAGQSSCPLSLSITTTPGSLGVLCKPLPADGTAKGAQTATVTFASDGDTGGNSTATLTCTAGRPDIAIAGTPLAFNTVAVNSSISKSFTVHNGGNTALTYSFTKTGSTAFTITTSACSPSCTIAANGADQTVTVRFSPTVIGEVTGTLTVDSNDPDPGDNHIDIPLDGIGTASQIALNPTSLPFGPVDVGKNASLVLQVSNTGNSDLVITSATFTGTGASSYAATDGTVGAQSTTVAAGGSTTWTIKCEPLTPLLKSASFHLVSNSLTGGTTDVSLSCTGELGALQIAVTPFDFNGVREGDSKIQNFTLTNTGNATVSNITTTLALPSIGYSIVTPLPSTTLAGGGSEQLTVKFAPTSAADGGPDTIDFSGTWGTAAPLQTTTAELNLQGHDQQVGYDTSSPTLALGNIRWDKSVTQTETVQLSEATALQIKTLTVTSAPSGVVTVSNLRLNGAVVMLPQTLSTLADKLTFDVTVTPTANAVTQLGPITGLITLHSDLMVNPDRLINVSANSVTPMLAVDPVSNAVDFGPVDIDAQPVDQTVTITNNGDGALSIGSIVTTGASFTFSLPTVPSDVAPHSSTTIGVKYTPLLEQSDTGSIAVALTGIHDMPATTLVVSLTGRGTDRHFALASDTLHFPDTFRYPGDAAPKLPVHVTNTGGAPLHIHMVNLSGGSAFTLTDTAMAEIAGGASKDFVVTFDPHAAGPAAQGVIEMFNDDTGKGQPDAVAHITLDGTGIDRDVQFGPATIDLGYTGIGIPRKLSDLTSEGLQVISMDAANTFHIHAITVDGSAFQLIGAPQDVDLKPDALESFDIEFSPTDEGDFTATVSLFLDSDPDPRANVMVTGHAVFVDAGGGGGCQASGGAGAGGLVLVAGALIGARRRRRAAAAIATGVTLVAGAALADEPSRNLDATVFHPTPSVTGTSFALQTASVGSAGDFALSALVSYANNPVELSTGGATDAAIANRTLIDLGGAVALLGRLELGAHMPLYAQSGDADTKTHLTGFSDAPASGTARGDLVVHGKLQLWRSDGGATHLGAAASLTIPTATDDQFAGVSKPEGRVLGLASFAFGGRLALQLNAGGVVRATSTYANIEQKSGFAGGAGVSYRVLDRLWADGEVFGELVPGGRRTGPAKDGMDAPTAALHTMEALVGLRYQVERRASIGIAVGRGLDDGFGSPAVRGVLSMTFVAGGRDLPPIHPPPPPKIDGDADGDGIKDSVDKCPNEAEDKDGFEDDDGCPDPDNDHDGILDADDKCPLSPEDKDGFQDDDGCPDLDNDKDGILDAQDKCPNEPEDKDGFQDGDGCPDPDNDHDGIPDDRDKCINEPETINGIDDDDGCPDAGDSLVIVSPDRLDMLDTMHWNGMKLAKTSFNLLGQIGATLRAHDEILRVRVTVHVQPSGNPAHDKEVTEKRAQAIREWLVAWGVAPARLEAKGFGGTKTIVAPDKKGAASLNERVELIILERK